MLTFKYMPVKYNFSSRYGSNIKYLVIHDTGNKSKGANALAHYKYFNGGNRNASAHYFVDDKEIIQIVGDSKSSWHVGDGSGKYGITNRNSIGIEMCINSDSDYNKAYKNTIELVKNLMVKFNISDENVIRHYDASRKNCPQTMNINNWKKWWEFKELIKQPRKLIIDTEVNSSVAKIIEEENTVSEQKYIRLFIHGVEAKSVTIKDGKSYLWIESIGKLVPLIEFFEILGLKVEERPYKNGTAIFVEN